ncbi:hypothetical protein HXX02_06550 [Microbulbifer elongatus]|uniref:Lipoprotein n=1 Tax=Microbulbifer elongatus TaxID=86173 RepID=A0ABT1NZ34_9GAMM|nr:hypothetical protein [Microbulbifer elongatus]MCQ3829098.1 hypothetical protein [Microbulbifer elongatus]
MKTVTTLSCLIFSPLLVSACSNQQIYEGIQQNRLQNCEKYPDAQYAECLARHQKDYEEYERERQALLKGTE